jgi:prephenate dehydratase
MSVLSREMGDTPNNFTRFFVLSKQDSSPSGQDKTSIIFSVKSIPGALHHVLKEFVEK